MHHVLDERWCFRPIAEQDVTTVVLLLMLVFLEVHSANHRRERLVGLTACEKSQSAHRNNRCMPVCAEGQRVTE